MPEVPCCPDLTTDPVCDIIDMRRRLTFPTTIRTEAGIVVNVEVILHTRFTRCSGPLALGDLAYSTTLLPGETVRLATTDRRSRFSFDSETNLAWRSEQISEEQYRMRAFHAFMSDANSVDRFRGQTTESGSWNFHGDASGTFLGIFATTDVNARGSHNNRSAQDYLSEHRAHVEASDHLSVEATRKAHSLSIGEVSTRTHSQGQSEDHWESSSRSFSNLNQCHAVTYFFYRINKTETITFTIESIERRVIDPVASMPVPRNPVITTGQVLVVPQELPATAKARPEAEERGINSEISIAKFGRAGGATDPDLATTAIGRLFIPVEVQAGQPLTEGIRLAALAEVDNQLLKVGLIDESGVVSGQIQEEFGYSRTTSLPTAGVIVKGCLDDCNTCEPDLQRSIQLDLENKELKNRLLARQIELLDKAQEYRCCPEGQENEGKAEEHDT